MIQSGGGCGLVRGREMHRVADEEMDRAVDEEVVGVADEQMVEVNFNFAILRMLCRLFRAE